MTNREIVVSGIRPTGDVHLGNYFGAIANFIKMQHEYNCYFFIADYHALTTHPDAKELPIFVRDALSIYLACGLDPDQCTLYIQSHLPQIPELYLLFNMLAYKGELEKIPTFKEKVRSQEALGKSINAGLLTYPVLMCVDIIIHRAQKVPVGKDQESHLEITRTFANRFNYMTGSSFFPEPYGFSYGNTLLRVPSLDNSGKMSKSEGNPSASIFLKDEDKTIRQKIMRATSDSGPTVPNQTKPDAIANLFDLLRLVSSPDTVAHFDEQYNQCTIRYGDLKKQLAEDMVRCVAPLRERYQAIAADTNYLRRVVQEGGEKARISANATLQGAKELIGLSYF
ncbi:MAG: tryptophan--tRNA ligase [Sphingobacteriales bacterium]|nr:tryptophan--tRNA ligase [Sphingobacteriales bacterium]